MCMYMYMHMYMYMSHPESSKHENPYNLNENAN